MSTARNDNGKKPEDIIRSEILALKGYHIPDSSGMVKLDAMENPYRLPEPLRAPLLELRRRYSTRPGEADIRLVEELGLFDYLSRRLAICGNPQDCLAQALAAKAAGAERLMLTVSLASDPVRTVELFGEHVLPKL